MHPMGSHPSPHHPGPPPGLGPAHGPTTAAAAAAGNGNHPHGFQSLPIAVPHLPLSLSSPSSSAATVNVTGPSNSILQQMFLQAQQQQQQRGPLLMVPTSPALLHSHPTPPPPVAAAVAPSSALTRMLIPGSVMNCGDENNKASNNHTNNNINSNSSTNLSGMFQSAPYSSIPVTFPYNTTAQLPFPPGLHPPPGVPLQYMPPMNTNNIINRPSQIVIPPPGAGGLIGELFPSIRNNVAAGVAGEKGYSDKEEDDEESAVVDVYEESADEVGVAGPTTPSPPSSPTHFKTSNNDPLVTPVKKTAESKKGKFSKTPRPPNSTSSKSAKKKELNISLEQVFDDLSSRFILTLPQEELSSFERICFHIESAHWFYLDNYRERHPQLPPFNLRQFAEQMFNHCPILREYTGDINAIFEHFLSYKNEIPVCGGIILNETLDKCVMVRGWKATNYGFPQGKINMNEAPIKCALREVLEETGFNAERYIDENSYFVDKKRTLYVIPYVPENTKFVTQTKKEISDIKWVNIKQINAGNTTKNSLSFLPKLLNWIKEQGKNSQSLFTEVNDDSEVAASSSTVNLMNRLPMEMEDTPQNINFVLKGAWSPLSSGINLSPSASPIASPIVAASSSNETKANKLTFKLTPLPKVKLANHLLLSKSTWNFRVKHLTKQQLFGDTPPLPVK